MKKILSLIVVSILLLGGIIFLQELSEEPMKDKSETHVVNAFPEATGSRSAGNIYYITTSGNDNNNGTSIANAWRTISKANQNLIAGDTVYIRGGIYDRINPADSGTYNSYITYKNYNSETVVVTGGIPIDLRNVKYIMVDGISVGDGNKFLHMSNASYCIIQNCDMDGAGNTGWTMISLCDNSDYNKLINNTFIRTDTQYQNELIELIDGAQHNLLSGNFFKGGTHGTLTLTSRQGVETYPTRYNIIRDNIIDASYGRAFAIRGHSGYGDSNVFENNLVYNQTPGPGNNYLGWSKINSDYNIIRGNVFYDSGHYLLQMESRSMVNSGIKGNRIYNNIFYNNYGTVMTDCCANNGDIEDNHFINNIYLNSGNIWEAGSVAVPYDSTNVVDHCIAFNSTQSRPDKINYTNIITSNPLFMNEKNYDFRLQNNSPAIDAGRFLTKTKSSGNGISISVEDARYFFDGYGITNGDLIQLEGQKQTARITNVDYINNTISINKSLTWNSNQGVNLPYFGTSPDIGAYAYVKEEKNLNNPPTLKLIGDQSTEEDHLFSLKMSASDIDNNPITWKQSTNASWLKWDNDNHVIFGTPSNADIGSYWINVNVTDNLGGYDEQTFTLKTTNVNPNIITQDITTAVKDALYSNDYDSDDDGQGIITWSLTSNATWLNIDKNTGVLSGIPTDDDIKHKLNWINLSVEDGNGGTGSRNFTLQLRATNNEPSINTVDVTSIKEDEYYEVTYTATDVDKDDILIWTYESNSDWLNWDQINHTLYGTPSNDDVGEYWVRINISDTHGGYDEHYFVLTVININDPPTISGVPTILQINALEDYNLDLTQHISDVDNEASELKLQTNSQYATVRGLTITFNYTNQISSENVSIIVSDGISDSAPYYIQVIVNLKNMDIEQPSIVENYPTGTNIPISTNITITFSESMIHSTVENAFQISPEVIGEFFWDNNKLIFNPISDLEYNITYSVTISKTSTDLEGNPLEYSFIWDFTTALPVVKESNEPAEIQNNDYDNDGFLNEWEEFLGTDPKDPMSQPLDTDGDGIPNGDVINSKPWMDTDDDGDGFSDKNELAVGTDPLDENSNAKNEKGNKKKEKNAFLLDLNSNFPTIILIIMIISIIVILLFSFIHKRRKSKNDVGRDKNEKENIVKIKHMKYPKKQSISHPTQERQESPMDNPELLKENSTDEEIEFKNDEKKGKSSSHGTVSAKPDPKSSSDITKIEEKEVHPINHSDVEFKEEDYPEEEQESEFKEEVISEEIEGLELQKQEFIDNEFDDDLLFEEALDLEFIENGLLEDEFILDDDVEFELDGEELID
jgi:hypothetical protein